MSNNYNILWDAHILLFKIISGFLFYLKTFWLLFKYDFTTNDITKIHKKLKLANKFRINCKMGYPSKYIYLFSIRLPWLWKIEAR